MKRRWLPVHVSEFTDRHGKRRYRYRRQGRPTYYFKNLPGTEEFRAELAALVAEQKPEIVKSRAAPGTISDLINRLFASPSWRGRLKPSSDKKYRRILERFRAEHGDKPVATIRTIHLDAILGKMADRPAAANDLRKSLRRLFGYAVKIGMRNDNPATATDTFKEGAGFHTWTDDEISQFETRWTLGTRQRLALALMLYTGQRRSDVVRLGPADVKGDRIILSQVKTGADISIRILPPLAEAIDAMPPPVGSTFIETEFGKPFSAAGFGNWFRDACNEAQLRHCSAHGLRKAMSRRLAEAGATNLQGRAVTGHKTDRMFEYYAEKADQARLADDALANLYPIGSQITTYKGDK